MSKRFKTFIDGWLEYKGRNPEQRLGQALFNYLFATKPEMASHLRDTRLDPFHKTNEQIPEVVNWIKANWNSADYPVVN